METNRLIHADCRDMMEKIPDGSVDLVLTDPPYGITAAKWDDTAGLEYILRHSIRTVKDTGVVVVFGQEPFSSRVRVALADFYRFDLVWKKQKPSNFQLMNYQPGRVTENIMVFSKLPACFTKDGRHMTYHPQFVEREKPRRANVKIYGNAELLHDYETSDNFKTYDRRHPTNVLEFPTVTNGKLHPTQKPVELLSWLIRSFSDEVGLVLDPYVGSGSTCIASIDTGRRYIGIEKDEEYYNIAKERIDRHE